MRSCRRGAAWTHHCKGAQKCRLEKKQSGVVVEHGAEPQRAKQRRAMSSSRRRSTRSHAGSGSRAASSRRGTRSSAGGTSTSASSRRGTRSSGSSSSSSVKKESSGGSATLSSGPPYKVVYVLGSPFYLPSRYSCLGPLGRGAYGVVRSSSRFLQRRRGCPCASSRALVILPSLPHSPHAFAAAAAARATPRSSRSALRAIAPRVRRWQSRRFTRCRRAATQSTRSGRCC